MTQEQKDKKNKYQKIAYYKNLDKRREYNRKSYYKNKDERDKKIKEYQQKNKSDVMNHYSGGNARCSCCGIKELIFLTIDHIEGDGSKQRKDGTHKTGSMFYIWLRKKNYPKGFQVLCYNCNQAKRQLKNCPHKELLSGN